MQIQTKQITSKVTINNLLSKMMHKESEVLTKNVCSAFIFDAKTTTSIGYIENANIQDIVRQNCCQPPTVKKYNIIQNVLIKNIVN